MRILTSLLKASVVAAAVFALAWIRVSQLGSSLKAAVGIFIGYGILIVILSVIIGFPLAYVIERCRMMQAWWCTAVGTATGALLGGGFTYRPSGSPVEIENPFALTFSPWNRDAPGFTDYFPYSRGDLVGSLAFGALVGAVLGLAFWYFYSRGTRPVIPRSDP